MPVTKPEQGTTAEDRYAPTAWASGGAGQPEDLEMPSGQWALVARPGPEGLIKAGIIQSLDALTGIVQGELIPNAEGTPKIDAAKLMANPKAITDVMHTMDRIVCHVVQKPKVEMTPNDVTRRKDGVIYADMVDLEDKMFIMNFAMGGTRDLETFRQESAKHVGGVDPVEVDGDQA